MNRIKREKQEDILAHLAEGNSLRGTAKLCRVSLNCVSRNMVWLGEAAQRFHEETVYGLKSSRIEADEAWSFIDTKARNCPISLLSHADFADAWTWVAIDPDSKFVPAWYVGKHEIADTHIFLNRLARTIPGRFQLTTDQLTHYRAAMEDVFGDRVDYATVVKDFAKEKLRTPDAHIEPRYYQGERKVSTFGNPDLDFVTTSSIESQNTRLRLWNKRMNRNTIAFSRRQRNMRAAVAIHFCYYNWCRTPKAIKCTPAMEAGLTDHIWEIEELVSRISAYEQRDVGYLNAASRKAA